MIVFALVARRARHPITTYRRIAVVALLLSFLPDIGLLLNANAAPFPGITIQSVGTLMVMHIVAAVISVYLLTTWTVEK